MIYAFLGKLIAIGENYFLLAIESEKTALFFKIFSHQKTLKNLPPLESFVKVYTCFYLRDEKFEIYGFLNEQELKLFELLNTVNGIGPKTALAILEIDSAENIMAAIVEKRHEFLTKTSGLGQKTAQKIVLELYNKIKIPDTHRLTSLMEINSELEELLVNLGYQRQQVKKVLGEIGPEPKILEQRLKIALKILSQKNQ